MTRGALWAEAMARLAIAQSDTHSLSSLRLSNHRAISGEGMTRCGAAAGLTTEDADTPFLLEASQGDRISGKISRAEVASLVSAALNTPASVGAGLPPAPARLATAVPPACGLKGRGGQSHAADAAARRFRRGLPGVLVCTARIGSRQMPRPRLGGSACPAHAALAP